MLSYRIALGLATLLVWLPVEGRADFLVEFTDGRQVTVGHYVDEGQMIKIYTPQGAIGFRKADVKRITEVDADHSLNTPLETMQTPAASSAQASAPASANQEKTGKADKVAKTDQQKPAEAGKTAETGREHLDDQYHDIAQQIDEVWEKHMRDVDSGASEEVLAENRRRLDELNKQRHDTIHAVRKAEPDDLPAWAQ